MWFLWFSFKVKWCHWHWRWTRHWCFDCALSEPNHITLVLCCLFGYSSYAPILIWWLFLQQSPSPSINCTFQQEDTTVVKKFQHILGLCSSSKQRKLENRYDASNLFVTTRASPLGDHMTWRPYDKKRRQGRPAKRWRDDLDKYWSDTIWQRTAQDRVIWRRHAEAFAQPRDTTAA